MSHSTHYKALLDEVEKKRSRVVDHELDLCLANSRSAQRYLEEDAKLTKPEEEVIQHSARIEHPLAHIRDLSKRDRKPLKKELKNIIRRLKDAWLTSRILFPEDGQLNEHYLIAIASKIEPKKAYRFRRELVIFGDYIPVEPDLIPEEIAVFLYHNRGISSPLEQALDAHFNIVRIHPFLDGNGRTARMIQNAVLTNHSYPSVLIEEGERHLYFDFMKEAINAYDRRKESKEGAMSKEEELLFEFLATKVNMAYDHILDC